MKLFSYKFDRETILITSEQIYLCGDHSHIRLANAPTIVYLYVNEIYYIGLLGLARQDLSNMFINNVVKVCFYRDGIVRVFCKIKGV